MQDPPSALVSRRERLKQERQDRILDAAASVFSVKGFHSATIRDIAESADVAEGTIYNYFENKADLLIGIMSRLAEVEHLPGELERGLLGQPREFFAATLRHRLQTMQQGQQMLRAILPEVLVNTGLRRQFYEEYVLRISRMLEDFVRAQIALGQVREVNVAMTVRIVLGMFVGLLFLRAVGDDSLVGAWDQIPEALASLLFDGLRPGCEEEVRARQP